MQLGDLPPELHSLITNHVCQTDTPASSSNELEDTFARPSILSLEQVSKYWSSIAQLYKYRVLKVTVVPANADGGESAVTRLLRRLASLPAYKRRTRYLHLSEPSQPTPESQEIDYTQTLPQLISLLSPTLLSLTLAFPTSKYSTSLIAATYAIHFQHLAHLRIAGFYPPPRLSVSLPFADLHSQLQEAQPETNFPALTHLRLSGVRNPSGILPSSPLHRIFPALRTLEIGGVSGAPQFAHDVAVAFAAHEAVLPIPDIPERFPDSREVLWDRSGIHRPSNLPATLTRVVISTNSPPSRTDLIKGQNKMLGVLEALKHRPKVDDGLRPRVEVTVVKGAF